MRMKTTAIVIAGGGGARIGPQNPKEVIKVNDKPILFSTLEAF